MADPITERAIFDRCYEGTAARDYATPRVSAWVAWQRRAAMAERHHKELVEALCLCYDHCRLYHPEVERNNVGSVVRAALANYSDEVVA